MKKGIAAILLFLYVAFSTGVVISFHYCMDSFDSFQFGVKATDICGKCGMHTKGKHCCSDEVKIFKIQDDQQAPAINFKFSTPDAVIATLPLFDNEILINSTHQLFLTNHSPPISKQDTYLQNCVFRI